MTRSGHHVRRRALLATAVGLGLAAASGCVSAGTQPVVERTVRSWQAPENRWFEVEADRGQTIRITFVEAHSDGAQIEVYRPDPREGHRVLQTPFRRNGSATAPVAYEVEEGGRHTVVVNPCCSGGGGVSYAWIRIYVE